MTGCWVAEGYGGGGIREFCGGGRGYSASLRSLEKGGHRLGQMYG